MIKKLVFLCAAATLVTACPLPSLANDGVSECEGVTKCVEMNNEQGACSTESVLVPIHNVLMWRIENTGEKDLHYSVISWSAPHNFSVVKDGTGIVKPGKMLKGSALGVDLSAHQAYIMLHGETSGRATLTSK